MKQILLVCAFSMLIGSVAKADEIRVLSDTWAPYAGVDMLKGGFSLDLLETILTKLGHTMKVEFADWREMEAQFDSKKFDVIPNVWFAQERERWLIYSQSYEVSELVFVSRIEQGFQFNALSALQGKSLALVEGYAYPQTVLSAPNVDIHYVKDVASILKSVVHGLVHVGLGDSQVLRFTAGQTIARQHRLHYDFDHPLARKPLHFTVNRQYPHSNKLVQDINTLILTFSQDGTLKRLKSKHGMR